MWSVHGGPGAMKMLSLAELSWTEDRAGRDQAH